MHILLGFKADPDLAFQIILDPDPDPDPGFDDQKKKKFTAAKNIFLKKKMQFHIPRPPQRTSKLLENTSALKK
jgi:hypothetical protein